MRSGATPRLSYVRAGAEIGCPALAGGALLCCGGGGCFDGGGAAGLSLIVDLGTLGYGLPWTCVEGKRVVLALVLEGGGKTGLAPCEGGKEGVSGNPKEEGGGPALCVADDGGCPEGAEGKER